VNAKNAARGRRQAVLCSTAMPVPIAMLSLAKGTGGHHELSLQQVCGGYWQIPQKGICQNPCCFCCSQESASVRSVLFEEVI